MELAKPTRREPRIGHSCRVVQTSGTPSLQRAVKRANVAARMPGKKKAALHGRPFLSNRFLKDRGGQIPIRWRPENESPLAPG